MAEAELLAYFAEYGVEAPDLGAAFRADGPKAWEMLRSAAANHPDRFDDASIAAALAHFDAAPREAFSTLHNLAAAAPDRAPALLAEFLARFPRWPAEALDAAYYVACNDPVLFRPALVAAATAHVPADPCRAFLLFQVLLYKRPELVGEEVIDAVLASVPLQVNQAFNFLREVVKVRPESTPKCILALFECVVHEPQAPLREDMLLDLAAVSGAPHVKASLEERLRQPPSAGSKRARTIMAILFRERLRARRAELFDALRHASGYELRGRPGWAPLWSFLLHLIDCSGDAISTAAADRFLEGAWQLSHLAPTIASYQEFATRFDLRDLPPAPFPPEVAFLDRDAELARLHGQVRALAERFRTSLELPPVEEFAGRAAAARKELEVLESRGTDPKVAARVAALEFRLSCWDDPRHAAALADPALEESLPPPWRKLVRDERRELAKRMRDVLQARAATIAIAGLEVGAQGAYAATLRSVLGREVAIARIESAILPALLYFRHVERMPGNRTALARLVEDRVLGRPHDWLRTEPAAARWAEKVKERRPGIRLDRWRAPFEKSYVYRPADAEGERKRRIREDLRATRALFEKMKLDEIPDATYDALREALAASSPGRPEGATTERLEEIRMNLERVRLAEQTPASDFEGSLRLEVEGDPFRILFMGEYGFTSCLSLRGSNGWSAVSNAIDVDKTVAWAKDPSGNVVARRLIALLPEGLASYRTYTNRPGVAVEGFFEDFLDAYAKELGTARVRGLSPRPLLSDRWYDDGPL